MFCLTTKSSYALSALTELALRGDSRPVCAADMAKQRNIPLQFLEQLLAVMRRGGIVQSQRGVNGGYRLSRSPQELTALEVVELLDGELGRDLSGVLAQAAESARTVLAQTTLADIIDEERANTDAPMYYI